MSLFTLSVPCRPCGLLRVLPLAAAAALLVACGGGGGEAPPANAPLALAYTEGTVEGQGAIVVNGVRFDASQAQVYDDQGQVKSASDIRLGMVVAVLAPAATADAEGRSTAQARELRIGSSLQGPIEAIEADVIRVLGQRVAWAAGTVFEYGRAATLQLGRVVEVHGLSGAQGVLHASRIDAEDDGDEPFKLGGVVARLDTQARTFWLGEVQVSYAALGAQVPALANGQQVRVRLARQPHASGQWPVTALRLASAWPVAGDVSAVEGVPADIEGYVSRIDGPRRFVVSGIAVDASNARSFPATLAVGDVVEVEGRLNDGVVLAREVELERGLASGAGFEVEGAITAVNPAASTFEVRGLTVSYANSHIKDGAARQFAVGVRVEVEGSLSPQGDVLLATTVEFD